MFRNTHASVGQNPGQAVVCRQLSVVSRPLHFLQRTTDHGPRSSLRSGISLIEVLIAMGILTIGLLGVAALFPVGSYYMQKGDVADRGSAVAQAAFNELLSRGILDPEKWLMWEDGVSTPGLPTVPTPPGTMNTFRRSFAEKMRQQLASLTVNSPNPIAKQWYTATEFGSAFVIDPIAISSVIDPNNYQNNFGSKFPGSSFALDGTAPTYYTSSTSPWKPWVMSGINPLAWTIHRVTVAQAPSTPLNAVLADRLFSSADDLAMDLPAARSKPSIQRWDISSVDLNGDGKVNDPLARQSRGDYSWIVTVSPTTADARNGLALDPSSASYEVSVAVFYKRIVGRTVPKDSADVSANMELLTRNERMVNARVVSTGLSGGELLLSPVEPDVTDRPFDGLKTGNWIMLCGPHPNSTQERPMFVARWYRVLSIEGKDTKLDENGKPTTDTSQPERRLVSVRGPQWPWQPEPNGDVSNDYYLGNLLCASIASNVVAVHSKTIRLEGKSAWSVP